MQAVQCERPAYADAMPAAHTAHADAFGAGWYVPAGHAAQTVASCLSVALAAMNSPGVHAVHAVPVRAHAQG